MDHDSRSDILPAPEEEFIGRAGVRREVTEPRRWRSLYVDDPEGNTVEWVCYDKSVG